MATASDASPQPVVLFHRGTIPIMQGEMTVLNTQHLNLQCSDGQLRVSLGAALFEGGLVICKGSNPQRAVSLFDWIAVHHARTPAWGRADVPTNVVTTLLEVKTKQQVLEWLSVPATSIATPTGGDTQIVLYIPDASTIEDYIGTIHYMLQTPALSPTVVASICIQSLCLTLQGFWDHLWADEEVVGLLVQQTDFQAWIDTLAITPIKPNPVNTYDPYYVILLTYIVAAKGYNNARFITTMKNRFEVFCTRAGISKYSLNLHHSTTEILGDFMSSQNGVWRCLGEYLFDAWPEASVLSGLKDQIKLSCEWGGLAGLKLAHDFVGSDQSAVWLLTPMCMQAKTVIHAWESLSRLDNPPYARMLGHNDDSWSHRMYPDVLYCARKVKLSTESSMEFYEIGELTNQVPRRILDEALSRSLETKTGERGPEVKEILEYKGLKEKEEGDDNDRIRAALLNLMSGIKPS